MKKLKIVLLFSLIFGCIYILCTIVTCNYSSKYSLDTGYIYGKILSYEIDGDILQLEVDGREKVIVFYRLSSEEEKRFYEDSLQLGDIYEFYGTLEEPSANTNFNLFSYKNYLLSKKIYFIMQADKISLYKESSSLFYLFKNRINNLIKNRNAYEYLTLFIFGNSDVLDSDVLKSYGTLGISHLIAISGMHISLFSVLLLKLLFWIKNKYIKYGMVISIIWFYAFLVGFTPSVLRAVISFTCISVFNLKEVKIKAVWILLASFLLFLLYNPFYIYNTGFLFSFIISFFLIISSKVLNKYKNYFLKTFIISLVAFLASIPIISISFFETNLLGPILNILFVPLISFIVFPLTLITFIFPFIEPLFLFIVQLLELFVKFCDNYCVISFVIPYMNVYIIIIYYIMLFLILYFNKLKYILLIFGFIFLYSYQNIFQMYSSVTMLDVGQGESILVQFPYNKGNILIDTGGSISYEKDEWQKRDGKGIADKTIIPYSKSVGVPKLDYLILTHGDYDHMGEAINLVNNFKVEKVIFNCGEFNNLEQELIKVLDKKKIPYYSCIKELNINNSKLYFLNNKDYDNENDNSSVIYTELNNHKFLFMGDAGVEVEEDLIEKYNLKDIDVLKVGHHGSKTSSSKLFIDEINPKYSIISVGKNNRYGHPNKEVLDILNDSKIYRTDQDGSIVLKTKNDKLNIGACSP